MCLVDSETRRTIAADYERTAQQFEERAQAYRDAAAQQRGFADEQDAQAETIVAEPSSSEVDLSDASVATEQEPVPA